MDFFFVFLIIVAYFCLSHFANGQNQKYKWAIIALTKPGRGDMERRNALIAHILSTYQSKHRDITIIVFSEDIFPNNEVSRWKEQFKGLAKVEVVSTKNNGYNLKQKYGYKYMCKFFTIDVYYYLN